jgi:hypothetical protein
MSTALEDLNVVADMIKGGNDTIDQYRVVVPRLQKLAAEAMDLNKDLLAENVELKANGDVLRKSAAEGKQAAEKGMISPEKREALVKKLAADGHIGQNEVDGIILGLTNSPDKYCTICERLSTLGKTAREDDSTAPALVTRDVADTPSPGATNEFAQLDSKYGAELQSRRSS